MEESTPVAKVTALIVSYNAAPAVRRSIAALEQSKGREEIEIIVVDCGSMDEGPTLDREFPGITVLRLERNFGATRALNIGMRTAAADYVLFLEPGVLVEPDTVMALAARLDATEAAVAVCPLLIGEDGAPILEVRKIPSPAGMPLLCRDPDSVPTTTVDVAEDAVPVGYPGRRAILFRKQFIRAFNWLDARYGEFGGDLELAFQVRRAGRKILILPGVRATAGAEEPLALDSAAVATLYADRAHGISVFLSKHFGWFAGIRFSLSEILHALLQTITFRQPAFQIRVLIALLSGQKIDGSQSTL